MGDYDGGSYSIIMNHLSKVEEQHVSDIGWKLFFDNKEPNNCPIEKCVLKNKDCSGENENVGMNKHLEIHDYSPWVVIARDF